MARRKKEPPSAHRARISDAAQRLFSQRGVTSVTVDDIAREAGYSKATLYVYFQDKEEIVRIARHIGTFETSILPYEDCCTVFTPRHPKTRPHVEEVREMEQALDVEGLVRRAMEGREVVKLR